MAKQSYSTSDSAVSLGATGDNSIAAAIFAMVDRAVSLRPEAAAELTGRIRLVFDEGFTPVVVDGEEACIVVGDDDGRPVEAEIAAPLVDHVKLITTPLARGVPSPFKREGRAALGKLAGGHVRIGGSRGLALKFLRLLSIDGS
jgi:hypothetical protein